MQKTTLKFKDVLQLWHFKQVLISQTIEINLRQCLLICDCTEDEIALAREKYGASVNAAADTPDH